MRVDQQSVASGAMSGEVNLPHAINRNARKIGARIEPVIGCTDIDVVDIKQQMAPAKPRQFGDEVPFGHTVIGKSDVA